MSLARHIKEHIALGGVAPIQYLVVSGLDRDSIQAAADALDTAGGGLIQLNPGVYVMDNRLDLPSNVTVKGAGRNLTILRPNTATLSVGGAAGVMGGSGVSNVSIKDLCVDLQTNSIANNGITFYPSTPTGLLGTRSSDIEIDNVKVLGYNNGGSPTGYGISPFRTDRIWIRNCYLDGGTTTFDGNSSQEGISLSGCTRAFVNHNYVTRMGNQGIIVANAVFKAVLNRAITMDHNIVEDCWIGMGGNFTSVYYTNFAQQSGNTFVTSPSTHYFEDGDIVRVSTDGTLPTGLSADTDYTIADANQGAGTFTLSGTTITGAGSGTHTITFQTINTSKQIAVHGNHIMDCRSGGIRLVTALQAADLPDANEVGRHFNIHGNTIKMQNTDIDCDPIIVDNQAYGNQALIRDIIIGMNSVEGGYDTTGTSGAIVSKGASNVVRIGNTVGEVGQNSSGVYDSSTCGLSWEDCDNALDFANIVAETAGSGINWKSDFTAAIGNMFAGWNKSKDARICIPMSVGYTDTMFALNAFTDTSRNGTFTVNTGTSTVNLNSTAHGLSDDEVVFLYSSANDLPLGLSGTTAYYVKVVDANTFTVATTAGGSDVAFSDNGSGTLTWTHETRVLTANADNYNIREFGNSLMYTPYWRTPIQINSAANATRGVVTISNGNSSVTITSSAITDNAILLVTQHNGTPVSGLKITPSQGSALLTVASAVGADTQFFWLLVSAGL